MCRHQQSTDPRCVAEVAHDFTYILDDSDVVFSAVIPELRCRKSALQDHCNAYMQREDDQYFSFF